MKFQNDTVPIEPEFGPENGQQRTAMPRQDERELREQLTRLRAEHRDLDAEIVVMEQTGSADQLVVKRLKRRKLVLKDQITSIEDQLTPDIIA